WPRFKNIHNTHTQHTISNNAERKTMSLSNDSTTMVMPVAPAYQGGGYGYGNGCGSMWGGDWASWIILFLIFGMFGWGGYGNFGGAVGGAVFGCPGARSFPCLRRQRVLPGRFRQRPARSTGHPGRPAGHPQCHGTAGTQKYFA